MKPCDEMRRIGWWDAMSCIWFQIYRATQLHCCLISWLIKTVGYMVRQLNSLLNSFAFCTRINSSFLVGDMLAATNMYLALSSDRFRMLPQGRVSSLVLWGLPSKICSCRSASWIKNGNASRIWSCWLSLKVIGEWCPSCRDVSRQMRKMMDTV